MLLTRWVPMLVIGSMVTLAPPAHGQVTSDPASRVGVILRELPNADSVLVERAWVVPRRAPPRPEPRGETAAPRVKGERRALPARTAPEQDVPMEAGRPGPDWAARFARVLAAAQLDPDSRCISSSTPSGATPRLEVRVKAYHRDRIRHFQIRFDERCVQVSDKPFGASLDVSPVAEALLDLVREALPGDSLLHKSALPPRVPVPPVRQDPSIVLTPPAADETPKYGEYVYVEELPEAVEKALPLMPPSAREAGVSGTVMVQALVGKDGLVKDTRVVKSIPMLDAAAIECVRAWRFKPALSHGQPVAVWVAVPVRFAVQ